MCEASFTQARKWQETCSDECSLERKRRADRAKALAGTKWKGDRFDAFPVLARGGWRCAWCGVPTPASLRGKHAPNSPEVDHKLPRAAGGTDRPDNLQCLCRTCNQLKAGHLWTVEVDEAGQAHRMTLAVAVGRNRGRVGDTYHRGPSGLVMDYLATIAAREQQETRSIARLSRGRGMGSAWIARALEARGRASMAGSA